MSGEKTEILRLENLSAAYNGIFALRDVSLSVAGGEVVSVLGPNGAGKTTLLRTISGLLRPQPGSRIFFQGKDIVGLPAYKIAQAGIAHVPEGRQVFPAMTVDENLEVAGGRTTKHERHRRIDSVYMLFTELTRRKDQQAGSLSGGEQQMLAIGRALMSSPKVLLLDEPSLGLAPILVKQIFDIISEINSQGTSILLVEQNAHKALNIASRGYVLENGHLAASGPTASLRSDKKIQEAYLGGAALKKRPFPAKTGQS